MSHSKQFLIETATLAGLIDAERIEELVRELVDLRFRRGRLFIIGLGGSAANASHMVNDFRRLCGIEAYSPLDNVAELTAAANDDGWAQMFGQYLVTSRANPEDAIFILSVGGGTDTVSLPISHVVECADMWGVRVFGIVGRDGGITAKYGDCCVIIPTVKTERITPHTEGWQSVILHCLVSHPDLQRKPTRW